MNRRTLLQSILALPALVFGARAVDDAIASVSPAPQLPPPTATMPMAVLEDAWMQLHDYWGVTAQSFLNRSFYQQVYVNGRPVTQAEYELWCSGVNIDNRAVGLSVYWQEGDG